MTTEIIALCPGQGAQTISMGKAWAEASAAAREVFDQADSVLGDSLGAPLSSICFDGPADRLNQTDVSQPAIYTCSVACWRGMVEADASLALTAAAGLSLGEYTALHLGGAFEFEIGLQLVADRGRLMQTAAEASQGGMVALIGAEEAQAEEVCASVLDAAEGAVLVTANFNAPGQIVLSGDQAACDGAVAIASEKGLRAAPLTVAGAFHSPLMQAAADEMGEVLASAPLRAPSIPVWSNVTARPHENSVEQIRQRLVEQIVSPVRWSQGCQDMVGRGYTDFHEMAPGTVLKGLMRRVDRSKKVIAHDKP